jgi:biphenyl-2,3-diol 1,2-dioxygenase
LSEPNDATFIAFETVVAAAFERVAGRLNAAGYELTEASDADVAAGRVGRVAHTPAPWGVRVELVQDLENAPMPFPSPLAPGGFLTDRIGFGYCVFATSAFDESHRFLVDGLGFAQSDRLETASALGATSRCARRQPLDHRCEARHSSRPSSGARSPTSPS